MTQGNQPAISKVYDPRQTEQRLYQFWKDAGYFRPAVDPSKKPFVIVMPPPNVTGELHVGHALTATLQDALVRWHRMKGDPTLWLPGTDHAGIATQVVVERTLAAEGVDRHQLGRERFLERVWEWVRRYGSRISEQHQRLGASCDWSRERFTMDPPLSRAVRSTFVRLYDKGLIYRGERLINWCPRCRTALSDLEVEHEDVQGHLWYMRYPYEDGSGYITVATTRPETYLGDTAVAVNPEDTRFRGLVGKTVVLPIIGRRIPIVADAAIDPKFGTGSVKVTPAHDPTDFEIGQRHGLELINVLGLDAKINEAGGPFAGQDRLDARGAIIEEFRRMGLLEKTERHAHAVGHCQRCHTIVEPMVSKQWFVKVGSPKEPDSIAGRAHAAVANGEIDIVPQRFTKVYLNWMENIRDWCISRQLWWGHRIPVWYCDEHGHQTVSMEDPTACQVCGSTRIQQDPDVLDTWFSSALWTHSTLGWPEQTGDVRYFYPTTVMETGYDILFFWVARMIMMGIENTGQPPFRTVFLHGMIRDEAGDKMSKMKGNVLNPLDAIDEYGTDALRFALSTGVSPGNDSRLSPAKLESSRNFANKIWNVSRYVLNASDQAEGFGPTLPEALELEDRWILSRLAKTTAKVNQLLAGFQLGEAQKEIYEFLWGSYADWYIELTKARLRADDAAGRSAGPLPVLVHVLETSMRLLHPFMPFLTEEVWQNVMQRMPPGTTHQRSIMIAPYPQADGARQDEEAERQMALLIDIITAIRNARAELKVDQARQVAVIIEAGAQQAVVNGWLGHIRTMARASTVEVRGLGQEQEPPQSARVAVLGRMKIILPMEGLVDLDAERQRLRKQRAELLDVMGKLEARLDDPVFTGKAPAAVVEKERARLTEYRERIGKLGERLAEIA